jgi:hypothetical protein
MTRLDALLAELRSRHRNEDPKFLDAVRPIAERILDPALPEAVRVPLLERLAETFERDVQIRRDTARALAAWQDFVARLRLLLGGQ